MSVALYVPAVLSRSPAVLLVQLLMQISRSASALCCLASLPQQQQQPSSSLGRYHYIHCLLNVAASLEWCQCIWLCTHWTPHVQHCWQQSRIAESALLVSIVSYSRIYRDIITPNASRNIDYCTSKYMQ